jgi:hypothetical protein
MACGVSPETFTLAIGATQQQGISSIDHNRLDCYSFGISAPACRAITRCTVASISSRLNGLVT